MRRIVAALLCCLFIAPVAVAAPDPCLPPPPVAAYLKTHAAWRMLHVGDLVPDDRKLWHDTHRGLCPGMANVVLDGSGLVSYALALIRQDKSRSLEQVVVMKAEREGYTPIVLVSPAEGSGIVVWRAPPGKTQDVYGGGRTITVAHDSIIWEAMESAAQQFYFARGKFHMIQSGD